VKNAKGYGKNKGTPFSKVQHKATLDAREAFKLVYEGNIKRLNKWLKETAEGYRAEHVLSNGRRVTYIERKPDKAAELLLRMAEHFIPKLERIEKGIHDSSDEELLMEVRRRRAEKERAEQQGNPVALTAVPTPK
jgi:hypothetical protein